MKRPRGLVSKNGGSIDATQIESLGSWHCHFFISAFSKEFIFYKFKWSRGNHGPTYSTLNFKDVYIHIYLPIFVTWEIKSPI